MRRLLTAAVLMAGFVALAGCHTCDVCDDCGDCYNGGHNGGCGANGAMVAPAHPGMYPVMHSAPGPVAAPPIHSTEATSATAPR